MAEEVDLDLLRNCTVLAVNKYPWATTSVNDTTLIGTMNLTHVIDLVSEMIDVFRERFLEDDTIKYVAQIKYYSYKSSCSCSFAPAAAIHC